MVIPHRLILRFSLAAVVTDIQIAFYDRVFDMFIFGSTNIFAKKP